MDEWDKLWIGWVVATLVAFGLIETRAVRSGADGATLSSNLRTACRRSPWTTRATVAAWLAFVAWFTRHIWMEGHV